ESQRSPVYQQELFNGHLYIFIKSENNELLDEIKNSLENPKKVLYLGRSEDIIFIKDVKEIKNDVGRIKVKESVKLTYPTYILAEGFPIKNKKYPVYFIPVKVIFENNGKRVKHKAEINKNTERKVEFKSVIYTRYNSTIILKKEECKEGIEVEIYRIGNKEIMIFEKWGWI
ncbi:MAG: type I-E CRISPR-associated protein Cas5/CasD, partial [Candidatus Aenigmatarchaeota archaeon]